MAGKVVVSATILAVGVALALTETGREHVIDVLRGDAFVLFVLAGGVGSRLVVDQSLREGDGGRDGQRKEGFHCCCVLLDVRRRVLESTKVDERESTEVEFRDWNTSEELSDFISYVPPQNLRGFLASRMSESHLIIAEPPRRLRKSGPEGAQAMDDEICPGW